MDAMEFFRRSAGTWRSLRVTHHLPFRRAESGSSEIQVKALGADDDSTAEICQMHEIDPNLCVGGALVSWDGSMAWDKPGEEHKGQSVFSIVPDPETDQKGRLLRERGYAETVPVVGRYEIDAEDALVLVTDYETTSIIERFWFPNPDLRLRTSAVKRFGGFNTATFCAEIRLDPAVAREVSPEPGENEAAPEQVSLWGW